MVSDSFESILSFVFRFRSGGGCVSYLGSAIAQVGQRIEDTFEARRQRERAMGQPYVGPEFDSPRLHIRVLGRLAASGRGQFLISSPTIEEAHAVMAIVRRWWVSVPVSVDSRGWRLISCRWFTPRQ